MKKAGIILGVAGCAVLLALVLMQRQKQETLNVEDVETKVGHASGLSAVADGPQDAGGTTQTQSAGLPDAGGTQEAAFSAPVKSLLLQDGKEHNYPSLLAEINKLNYTLSDADVAALIDMLAWPNDQFPEGMRAIEINAVKNDVLDKLLRQETLPEGIGLAMAEMAADPNQDVVWRDYCVQFMGPFYERASLATKNTKNHENENPVSSNDKSSADNERSEVQPGGENKPDELKVIQDAMFQALDERTSTIAGTALIGLENLSRTHEEFDREEITSKAVEIASDELASATSRMTALRLAAGLTTEDTENTETVVAARSLAQTGDTVLLRSAAIVTVGEVGSDADRELLQSYLLDEDRQIAAAAQQALNKMDERANAAEVIEEPKLADTTPKPSVKEKPILINQL